MTSLRTPTPEEVARAVAMLAHDQHRREFFDRLNNPQWIKPLREKGFFKSPPPVIKNESEGTVAFPSWSQSRFLARMSSLEPSVVLETILAIEKTDNVRVLEDLVDAALAMPADLAVKLVPSATRWASGPYFILLPRKLGDFIEKLAVGGWQKQAIDLARALLTVIPDPRPPIPLDESRHSYLSPEPKTRFDIWEYREILRKNVPRLVETVGLPAFSMLSDLLEDAVRLSRRTAKDGFEDYSFIWRPAIEEHAQNLDRDVRDMLVASVRDASDRLASIKPEIVPELVRVLRRHRFRIFLRLAHNLLLTHPDAAPELVQRALSSRGLFVRARSWHEYALLLKERFAKLPTALQDQILTWVEKGPNQRMFAKRHQNLLERPPTDDETILHVKGWQRDHLALISNALPDVWKHKYSALVDQMGEAAFPEFTSYRSGGSWGYQSSKQAKDLEELDVGELIEYLRSWQPSDNRIDESPEGLGRQITAVVTRNPVRFALAALEFSKIEPTYVRALIDGLKESVKGKVELPWAPILSLCEWVVAQPRTIPKERPRFAERDPDWGWARTSIARLLSAGLEADTGSIPLEMRAKVWSVLRPLSEDPEPSADYEKQYGSPNMDFATLSINTTRGEAMHTVMRYALWLRRGIESEPDKERRLATGFGEMPEVRDVLDAHLSPQNDSSLAIRSVYGQWLPWLVLLDANWVKERLTSIFPEETSFSEFRDVCWETYIVACAPYDNVFAILEQQYISAANRLTNRKPPIGHLGNPSEHLAQHLMTLYWRGRLSFDRDGALVRFYANAPDELCGRAFTFVGRSLNNTKDIIPDEIVKRLHDIWLYRFAVIRESASPEQHGSELAAFGWWFASGKLAEEWSLSRLLEALNLHPKTDVSHMVVERLATLAEKYPLQAIESLGLMFGGATKGWEQYGWQEHSRLILEAVLGSGNKDARQKGIDLIHSLGQRGVFDFRKLLP